MKTLRNWNDLAPYGIICLTGEACGYGMRLLCDVTPAGKASIERFFCALDMTMTLQLPSNWNCSDGQIGAIMLPPDIFTPLAAFLLMDVSKCRIVLTTHENGVLGIEESDGDAHELTVRKHYT